MVKVVPTGGCYLRVQRERMLGAVGGGGAADSSRTSWVPNSFDDTPPRSFATITGADWRHVTGVLSVNAVVFQRFLSWHRHSIDCNRLALTVNGRISARAGEMSGGSRNRELLRRAS